mgnify:CR=1 FL=1
MLGGDQFFGHPFTEKEFVDEFATALLGIALGDTTVSPSTPVLVSDQAAGVVRVIAVQIRNDSTLQKPLVDMLEKLTHAS